MTRRKLITLLGGLAAAPVVQPFVARADKTRRIGVLMNLRSDDPEGQNRLAAFVQALQKFGWTEGSNIHTDVRWAGDDADLSRRYAEELVALAPDVLLASGTPSVAAFQRVTRTSRSFSPMSSILSAQASSVAWHGRGATQPDLFRSNTASAGNGLNCSRSSRRKRRA